MKISLESGTDAATPMVFALNANCPDPFNPMTKISFSLPERYDVRPSVYSIDAGPYSDVKKMTLMK